MDGPCSRIETRTRIGLALGLLALACGCSGVKTREPRFRNAVVDFQERRAATQAPAEPWAHVLVQEHLVEVAETNPGAAAVALEAKLAARPDGDGDGALALAELSYRAGIERQGRQPLEAISWYRDASALATIALREPGEPNPTRDEAAILVHNQAAARLIRVAQAESKRIGGEWRQVLEGRGVALNSPTPDLAPDRFADLLVVDDVRVAGMQHVYRTEGLGVPLIVHRRVEATGSPDPLDRFHPRELRSAATALVTPVGGLADHAWRREPVTLAWSTRTSTARSASATATSPWPATGPPRGRCRWPRGRCPPSN